MITSRDRRGRPNQAGAWDHFLIVGRPTGLGCPGSLPETDEADQTRLRGLGSLPRRGQTDRARLPRITSRDRRGRPNQAGAWDHFLIVGRPNQARGLGSLPRRGRTDRARLPTITSRDRRGRPNQARGLGSLPHHGQTNRAKGPGITSPGSGRGLKDPLSREGSSKQASVAPTCNTPGGSRPDA